MDCKCSTSGTNLACSIDIVPLALESRRVVAGLHAETAQTREPDNGKGRAPRPLQRPCLRDVCRYAAQRSPHSCEAPKPWMGDWCGDIAIGALSAVATSVTGLAAIEATEFEVRPGERATTLFFGWLSISAKPRAQRSQSPRRSGFEQHSSQRMKSTVRDAVISKVCQPETVSPGSTVGHPKG